MKKNCTNCRWAEFTKYPSGRRNLDQGECKFETMLPHSFSNYRGEMPTKNGISKYTKSDCECWLKINK